MHSVSPPVFVKGNEFAFSLDVFKTNGYQYAVSMDMLYTDYGFLIPYNTLSFNIIDALDTKGEDYQVQTVVRGMILDHRGYLYEISIDRVEHQLYVGSKEQDFLPSNIDLNKNRLLYGEGGYFARGYSPDQEATAQAALAYSKTLEEALNMYCASSIEFFAGFKILKFSDVVKVLREKNKTKPINFRRPISDRPAMNDILTNAVKDLHSSK